MSQRLIITWLLIVTIAAGFGYVFSARLDGLVEDQAALKVQLTGLEERNRIEHEEFRSAGEMSAPEDAMMDEGAL